MNRSLTLFSENSGCLRRIAFLHCSATRLLAETASPSRSNAGFARSKWIKA